MKCAEIRKKIQDFLSGTCSLSLYREISSHLEKCEKCREYENDLKKLLSVLKKQSFVSLPKEAKWNKIEKSIFNNLDNESNLFENRLPLCVFDWKRTAVAALLLISFVCILGIPFGIRKYRKNVVSQTADVSSYPKLVNTIGSVSVVNDNIKSENSDLEKNGITIKTADSSLTNVLLNKRTTLSLDNNTVCRINKLSIDTQIISLQQGNVLAKVGKRGREQKFRIETPNAFCDVVGTQFKVWYDDTAFGKCVTRLAVYKGSVVFGVGLNKEVPVDSGYCIEAVGETLGKPVLINKNKDRLKNKIMVISEPDEAIVSINGNKAGLTPLSFEFEKGVYQIKVYKNGYSMWEKHLNLAKYEKDTIRIKLRTALGISEKSEKISDSNTSDSVLINKVVELIDSENYDSALIVLNDIVCNSKTRRETKVLVLTKMAYCQSSMGRHDKAVEALLQIVNGRFSDDQKGSALFRIATIKKDQMHDYDGAVEALIKYFKDYSEGIWIEEVGFSLAELLVIKGMFNEAASVYEVLMEKEISIKGNVKILYNLAQLYLQHLKDNARALELFTLLDENFPGNIYSEDALFWRANCLFELGRITQSFNEYSNYLSNYPDGKWVEEIRIKLNRTETAGVK